MVLAPELADRLGVRPASALHASPEGVLPVPQFFAEVLGAGLRRGSTISITSLAIVAMVMAQVTSAGMWCAVVGVPALSPAAAARAGVDLRRCLFVAPAMQTSAAVAALVGGVDLLVLGEPERLGAALSRQFGARARQAGTVLLGAGAWPSADVRLQTVASTWFGPEDGYGELTSRSLQLKAFGRRIPTARLADVQVRLDGFR